jgi:hypothetical protein
VVLLRGNRFDWREFEGEGNLDVWEWKKWRFRSDGIEKGKRKWKRFLAWLFQVIVLLGMIT